MVDRDGLWEREFCRVESGWIRKSISEGMGRLNFDSRVEFPTGLTGELSGAGWGN